MRDRWNVLVLIAAALCVAGFVFVGTAAVVVVVLAVVAALTWLVATASVPHLPQQRRGGYESGRLISHQRDGHILGDERRQRQ